VSELREGGRKGGREGGRKGGREGEKVRRARCTTVNKECVWQSKQKQMTKKGKITEP
jgi:hypothetical protein